MHELVLAGPAREPNLRPGGRVHRLRAGTARRDRDGLVGVLVFVRARRNDRVDQDLDRAAEPARLRSSPMGSWSASSWLRRRRFTSAGTSSGAASRACRAARNRRPEDLVVADPLEQAEGRSYCASVSPEADDDIGRDRDVRDGVADPVESLAVVLDRVLAAHPPEDRVVARLDGQVERLTDGRAVGHRVDQPIREVPRM